MTAPVVGNTPILPIATHVMPDEPCYRLEELNLLTPNNKGYHRYQIVWVVRADRLAEHRIDMGVADDVTPQVRIMGGEIDEDGKAHLWGDSVGKLRDWADWWRGQQNFMATIEPTDLLGEWRKDIEEKRKASVGQSTFGPALVKQR